ncbi:hypothetical protein BD310DRAFT_994333 [Dichomitus squalens]|uniref:Uncharacterized protein n=1 Tax=Dichomitus squalens TaxID=114155 RepID=A0A4Q9PHH5_9APHY|nr:hypothetical protein BD310DRAFT_994333 [Dichomitus squalens]
MDPNSVYINPGAHYSSSLPSPLPAPTHSSIAALETSLRLEIMDLRRQFLELRIQVEEMKRDKTSEAAPVDGDDSRATLKRLVFESVKATHALRPEEPLGHDEVREQHKFPNVKFFTGRHWTSWKRDNKKTTRIGEEPVRGKKMSAQGVNHTAHYVEHIDGTPAEGDYINDARKFCRTFINLARGTQYPLPKKWGDADTWLQDLFYTALRKKFPLFQLCHNNSKGEAFMAYTYYEAVTRKWGKASSQPVHLNKALHTIGSPSDSEESESESVRDVHTSGPSARPTSNKRPSGNDEVVAGPRKQARTELGVARDVVEAPPAPSKPAKGKERADLGLLHVAPPPSILPPTDTSPTSTSAAQSAASASTSSMATSAQFMQAPPVALSPLASLTTLAMVSGATGVIPSPPSPPTPTNPNVPAEGGVDISASPPEDVTPPGTAPSNEQPSKPVETTASKKPRAPRKTMQWPPAPDLKGAKWVYARKWYMDAHGTLEAFEAHYKTLSSSDRRKLGRVAPS